MLKRRTSSSLSNMWSTDLTIMKNKYNCQPVAIQFPMVFTFCIQMVVEMTTPTGSAEKRICSPVLVRYKLLWKGWSPRKLLKITIWKRLQRLFPSSIQRYANRATNSSRCYDSSLSDWSLEIFKSLFSTISWIYFLVFNRVRTSYGSEAYSVHLSLLHILFAYIKRTGFDGTSLNSCTWNLVQRLL